MSSTSSSSLDLSARGLTSEDEVRAKFLSLTKSARAGVEYLYLNNNRLTRLPPETIKLFPRLRWLDLRQNDLASLEGLEVRVVTYWY
jgi:Leucine-rich repeat (LRR) protein